MKTKTTSRENSKNSPANLEEIGFCQNICLIKKNPFLLSRDTAPDRTCTPERSVLYHCAFGRAQSSKLRPTIQRETNQSKHLQIQCDRVNNRFCTELELPFVFVIVSEQSPVHRRFVCRTIRAKFKKFSKFLETSPTCRNREKKLITCVSEFYPSRRYQQGLCKFKKRFTVIDQTDLVIPSFHRLRLIKFRIAKCRRCHVKRKSTTADFRRLESRKLCNRTMRFVWYLTLSVY